MQIYDVFRSITP